MLVLMGTSASTALGATLIDSGKQAQVATAEGALATA